MADDEKIVIKIATQGGDLDEFLIKRNMLMGKVMDKYCKLKNLERRSLRFLFDGVQLTDVDTAISLELKADDVVDVFQEQLGGSPDA